MSQSDPHLLLQSKPLNYALVVAAAAAMVSLTQGRLFSALLTALLIAVLLVLRVKPEWSGQQKWIGLGLMAIIAVVILFALATDLPMSQTWLIVPPLVFAFLLPAKHALIGTLIYVLCALYFLAGSSRIFDTAQLGFILVLCAFIAGAFAYLRDIRQRQLQPLRRTDNLTTAATQEHLVDDLAKEIQRSEREGSELSVIALALDREHLERLAQRDLDNAVIEIGRLLHNNLRLFDSYYLWRSQEFLVVLPHTSSAQAVKIANTIRVKIRRELKIKGESISVSMGVSGLNVGDEPRSLTQRAERALEMTRSKASNRTLLHRDSSDESHDEAGSIEDNEASPSAEGKQENEQ